MKPLCFVLMPFGKKKDAKGREIDFNTVYDELIKPAIVAADMEPIRADEEMVGGIIHKPMFERLLMCEYAIADLSIENANVYYELGIRHAARPHSTLSIFNSDIMLPFDVRPLRALPYHLDARQQLSDKENDRVVIMKWLNAARKPSTDSPLFQFFDDLKPHAIPHEKTDIFRERVQYSEDAKKTLFVLRQSKNLEGLKAFESSLKVNDTEGGILIDLFLSYRALDGWNEMIDLVEKMPEHLRRSLMVQEQLGFALNRAKRGGEAERVLLNAIETYGANSETYGILGRIYKDRWKNESDPMMQQSYLRQSIDMYVQGFEADWRDAYPGVNAVTLMTFLDTTDPRQGELLPVVRFAVNQKVVHGKSDYWDYATLMELEILSGNMEEAKWYLLKALPLANEGFMSKTTMDTLIMIQNKWDEIGIELSLSLISLIDVLNQKYESLKEKSTT
jgi:tetratricopeptide (TPR) repeat protein